MKALSLHVVVALAASAAPAAADAKTKALATGYTKELEACRRSADGVNKVTVGAQRLVDSGQHDYAADLAQLRTGLDQVQAYCSELDATLLLIADPNVAYKPLERQLDDHDNKIRKLRQASKHALETVGPVIGKLVPAINARAGTPDAVAAKKTPIKFPSGRTIEVPALAGAWRVAGSAQTDTVEYTEGKLSATISVRLVDGNCADRKKDVPRSAVDEPDATKTLAWYVGYAKDTRRVRLACRATKTGSLVGTIDDPESDKWPALEPVMTAMLAARDSK